jgi:hypothetical protein
LRRHEESSGIIPPQPWGIVRDYETALAQGLPKPFIEIIQTLIIQALTLIIQALTIQALKGKTFRESTGQTTLKGRNVLK